MKRGAIICAILASALLSAAMSNPTARAQASEVGNSDQDLAEGERLYEYHCEACHGSGPRRPGTAALKIKYDGELPALLTERTDLTPEAVSYFVRQGIGAMPFFRKTEISDADLEKIGAFIASDPG